MKTAATRKGVAPRKWGKTPTAPETAPQVATRQWCAHCQAKRFVARGRCLICDGSTSL